MFLFNLNVVFTTNFLKMARIRVRFSPEAGFLVWIGYVPVLKYVPFRRKGMTLEKKYP
jgi:hypothetical protein